MYAGQLARFVVTGQVLFNSQSRRSRRQTRGLVSFVEQDDNHHLPALTVRETLRYAAGMRTQLHWASVSNDSISSNSSSIAQNHVAQTEDIAC